jgi:hypothetical protein
VTPPLVVHVPDADRLIRAEVLRRHPGARLRPYGGSPLDVRRRPGDVLVIYCTDPLRAPHGGGVAVGVTVPGHESRAVLVFVVNLMSSLRLRPGDAGLNVAIGRTVAHELEHVRRGKPGHDRRGWFRRCADLDDLRRRCPECGFPLELGPFCPGCGRRS